MTIHPVLPWLAPDGLPWVLAPRRTRPPRVSVRLRPMAQNLGLFAPRTTPVYRACLLSIDLIGAGPLAGAVLRAMHHP